MTAPLKRRYLVGAARITTRRQAAALYRAGHTIACVTDQIGRPWSTTRDLLTEARVEFRHRGTRCTASH